ncbi:MAG: HD domain-containing phosphohydrolase, partial [Desulfosalsimonadaceae bacterium]|nr:HD domain-containing phosphohydrolase [Desulfosalsimonadaceae bacterium]
QIVYQHHERMNGSGYPRKLKGSEILLEAKILAVADVMEAMSSHRPYRAALPVETALNTITTYRGTLFDETVVDSFLSCSECMLKPTPTAPCAGDTDHLTNNRD